MICNPECADGSHESKSFTRNEDEIDKVIHPIAKGCRVADVPFRHRSLQPVRVCEGPDREKGIYEL